MGPSGIPPGCNSQFECLPEVFDLRLLSGNPSGCITCVCHEEPGPQAGGLLESSWGLSEAIPPELKTQDPLHSEGVPESRIILISPAHLVDV